MKLVLEDEGCKISRSFRAFKKKGEFLFVNARSSKGGVAVLNQIASLSLAMTKRAKSLRSSQ
jgi:hypothetical protein